MKLSKICAIVEKEHGLYITLLYGGNTVLPEFFRDSDDLYESPFFNSYMDKEVVLIETLNNHLNIYIK